MNRENFFKKIIAAVAVCAMLAVPCGCGKEEAESQNPAVPAPEYSQTSGSDAGMINPFDEEAAGPVSVIMNSAEAMCRRDLNGYMAAIDPDSDVYDSTREDAQHLFAHYRLTVSIDDVKVVRLDDDSAVITVTQTTLPVAEAAQPVSGSDVSASDVSATDVSGSDVSASDVSASDAAPLTGKDLTDEFVPCVTVLTHTMTCRNGVWYISSTVVDSYREISTQWDLLGEASAADPGTFVLSANLPVSATDAVSGSDEAE